MNVSGNFSIEKQAKSKGGDRYSGILSDGSIEDLTRIYLPQTVSRHQNKKPSPTIYIRIKLGSFARKLTNDDDENTDCCLCTLTKVAKSTGGDRYDGEINDEVISLYISQVFTRAALKGRPFQHMHITFSRKNSTPSKSRAQSPTVVSSLGKRDRESSLLQSPRNDLDTISRSRIVIDVEEEFDEDVEIQPNLGLEKIVDQGSTSEVIDGSVREHFEAFEEKRRDDSIIDSICDASGGFDLDLYFRMKMVRPNRKHLLILVFFTIEINNIVAIAIVDEWSNMQSVLHFMC